MARDVVTSFMEALMKALTALGAALISAAQLAVPVPAAALGDNCQDVRISVFNNHPVEIKITKIEYRDYDRENWRSEDFVDRKIATTKHYQFVRNLEHVENDDTSIRITYRESLGGSRWSDEATVTGAKHKCSDGEYNRFNLPGPTSTDVPQPTD